MPFPELENYPEAKKKLFRKGVSALIVNSEKEFLLVNLESFEKHFFAVPGGGLDDNEHTDDAVYREVQEELGITRQSLEYIGACKEPLQFAFKTKKLHRNGREYDGSERYFFGFKFTGRDADIRLAEGEIRSYIWSPYEKLREYLLFENQLEDTQKKILEIKRPRDIKSGKYVFL